MRIIIAGGGDIGVELADALIKEKHDVVLIEADPKRADELAQQLDCLVINGNAAHPQVLEEAGIKEADVVLALTNNDRDNIIISILAKLAGVKKTIVKIEDPYYNDLLLYLGITDIINTSRLISAQALSMLRGFNLLNLSLMIRGNIRFYFYRVPKELEGKKITSIKYDKEKARILLVYRDKDALFPEEDLVLKENDNILFAVRADYLEKLIKELQP
ncbi:MAG: NAD-binding protein [Staphylothermus sp.]|nr:NAD-binding protein [Staphylothermus sp.]